jgi:hypothetical protein
LPASPHAVLATSNNSLLLGDVEVERRARIATAHAAALCTVFGPMVPTISCGPPDCTGEGPTGRTDLVIFSPGHTRFMITTRSAMPRIVWLERPRRPPRSPRRR